MRLDSRDYYLLAFKKALRNLRYIPTGVIEVHMVNRVKKAALVVFALAITGCQASPFLSTKPEIGPKMPVAPLPTYVPGEFYEFDNGSRYTVTAVSKDRVSWRNNKGAKSTRYVNFVIPELQLQTKSRVVAGRTDADPRTLWPLALGNQGEFSFVQRTTKTDTKEVVDVERRWKCAVNGTKRVVVPAGTFNTFVIKCDRFSLVSGSLRGTRIYYYSPKIGYYVMREDMKPRSVDHRRQLVRHGFRTTLLPKKEQASLIRTLTRALETNPDGVASTWNSSSRRISAMLVPVRSYKSTGGAMCRKYYSVYNVNGHIHKNARRMCKDRKSGNWKRIG